MHFNFLLFWYIHPKTGRPLTGFKTQLAGGLQEDKHMYLLATNSYDCVSCTSLEMKGLGKEKA